MYVQTIHRHTINTLLLLVLGILMRVPFTEVFTEDKVMDKGELEVDKEEESLEHSLVLSESIHSLVLEFS